MPHNFPFVLQASLRRAKPNFFTKALKIRRSEVARALPMIIRKFTRNNDGTLSISPQHDSRDRRIIVSLGTSLFGGAAFSDDRLYNDFTATMRSHQLLLKSEERDFLVVKPTLSLFAMAVMHRCTIRIDADDTIRLHAHKTPSIEGMGICAAVPVPLLPGNRIVFTSIAVFLTRLRCEEHCSLELQGTPEWDFNIEVDPSGCLVRLG